MQQRPVAQQLQSLLTLLRGHRLRVLGRPPSGGEPRGHLACDRAVNLPEEEDDAVVNTRGLVALPPLHGGEVAAHTLVARAFRENAPPVEVAHPRARRGCVSRYARRGGSRRARPTTGGRARRIAAP